MEPWGADHSVCGFHTPVAGEGVRAFLGHRVNTPQDDKGPRKGNGGAAPEACWETGASLQSRAAENRNTTTSTHAQPSLPSLNRCFLKTHSYSDSSLLSASGFYHFAFPCRPFRLPPSIWGISRSMGPWRLDEILNTKRFSLFLSNCQMLPPGSIFPGGSQV